MDPMALLQYQFLMARAAEYRAIATRQAMIANARMGGFTAVGDAATAHAPELDKVRFVPMFSARPRSANFHARLDLRRRRAVADDTPLESPPQIHLLQQMQAQQQQFMAAQAMAPEDARIALVQQGFDARAGSFDDSTVARVLQNLKEDSPTHSGQARVTRDANDDSPEASRAMKDKQRGTRPSLQRSIHPSRYPREDACSISGRAGPRVLNVPRLPASANRRSFFFSRFGVSPINLARLTHLRMTTQPRYHSHPEPAPEPARKRSNRGATSSGTSSGAGRLTWRRSAGAPI